MSKFKNILLIAGGTGGHVFPAYSLARYFKSEKKRVNIITDDRGYKYLKEYKFNELIIINSNTIFFKNPFKILYSILQILEAFLKSFYFLYKTKPDIIFGMGGYLSFPVCVSALILGKPIVIYENNTLIGKANKFLSLFAKKIFTSFPEVKGIHKMNNKKIFHVGNLIREEFLVYNHELVNNESAKLNILVLGGSQAAKIFGEKLPFIFNELKKFGEIKITQQCLEKQNDTLAKFYNEKNLKFHLFNFSKDVLKYFKASDIVITRSGSSILAELINCNIPFVAIPLPSSTDNHQLENAKYFEKKGLNFLIEQNEIESKLFSLLKRVLDDKSLLSQMMNKQKKYSDINVYANINKELENILI